MGVCMKKVKDPLEVYFLTKFKEMGIVVVPPKKRLHLHSQLSVKNL